MPSELLKFGEFELDISVYELRRAGRPVKLEKIPMDLLLLLAEKRGSLVTREEILARLWGDEVFIDAERAINTAIYKIRLALHEDPDKPRFIQTVVGKGYRFVGVLPEARNGEVSPVAPGSAQAESTKAVQAQGVLQPSGERVPGTSSLRRWGLAAGSVAALTAVLLVLNVAGLRDGLLSAVGAGSARPREGKALPYPRIESIAVLPLENLSRDPEQEYFADGMTDELITNLGKISALRVISRQSTMRYKGSKKPLPEIAKELNVDAVVEGTVQRSGDWVRITAQLIQASPEKHLWAESYQRDTRDVLPLQEDVARDIAREIRVKLTPQEKTRLSSSRPVNPEAHEAYLKGTYFWNKRTELDLEKSISYFELAVQKDPSLALAYAGLGNSYEMLTYYGHAAPQEICPKAYDMASKALTLDSTLAEAQVVLGFYKKVCERDLRGADAKFQRAIELNPGYALAHVRQGEALSEMGRHKGALAELDRARELDPTSLTVSDQRGMVLYMARRYDEAIEQIRKTVDLEPRFAHAHCWLGKAYLQKGLLQEGLAELQEAANLPGGDSPLFVPWLGYAYALSGKRTEAFRVIQTMKAQRWKSFASPYGVAAIYCGLGEKDLALAWLEKAYQERDPLWAHVKVEPALDPLRSDPRFQDLLRRMNFPP